MRIFVLTALLFALSAAQGFSEEPPPDSRRTEKGYQVAQDNYLNIPPDMRVQKVGSNVITPEPEIAYLSRKLDEQNAVMAQIQTKLDALDARLQTLETKQ